MQKIVRGPIRILDASPMCDGAAAVVLTSNEKGMFVVVLLSVDETGIIVELLLSTHEKTVIITYTHT